MTEASRPITPDFLPRDGRDRKGLGFVLDIRKLVDWSLFGTGCLEFGINLHLPD